MSKVLTSFLVGIGYDTKGLEAGERKIQSSLQGVKGSALGISAALVGAFSAGAAAVAATASRVDQLALSTQNLRTAQNTVYDFGNAIRLMGGDAADAVATLQGFEQIQNDLRIKGQAGPITELSQAGIDVSSLYGTQSGEEFARALSGMLPGLDEGQRAVVQETLGLSDATFRTLVGGIDQLNASMQKANSLTGNVEQLSENSRKLMESSAEFGLAIEGVTNELSEKFLPSLVGASDWVTDLISSNREAISDAVDFAAENSGATTALGASASAAIAGAGLSKIGLSGIGGAVSKAGTAGVAISAGALFSSALNDWLTESVSGYGAGAAGFDAMLRDVLGVDRIISPSELLFGSPSVSDAMPISGREGMAERERQANAESIAGALSRTPIKVESTLNVQLDGQAIEAKIVDVTERMSYTTMEDIKSTTER